MGKKKNKSSSPMMPDWSQLPEELICIVWEKLEDCIDVVHARSVCTLWRSTFPFPCCLLSPRYSLPSFAEESKDLSCTLQKIPLFLFRVRRTLAASNSEYFLGGIARNESEDHMELECSVKLKIPKSDGPTLMNMLDFQIFPLGHRYRITSGEYFQRGVAFLPLSKEGGGGFVVLLNYFEGLLVLKSSEMRWERLRIYRNECTNLVTFRGMFYATYIDGRIDRIDPYSLKVTHLRRQDSRNYLVSSSNDELFLVKKVVDCAASSHELTCRVCRLDEELHKWVEVSDLGDRILFIGESEMSSARLRIFLMVVV